MSRHDPLFVNEQPALPAYAEEPAPASEALRALLKGCLVWLWSLLSRFFKRPAPEPMEDLAVEGRVKVLLAPSPGTYWYATLFTPAPEVIQTSRQALKRYCAEYQEPDPDGQPYPWRLVMARHTGLPALMRGFLGEKDQLDTPDDVAGITANWLFQDLRAEALFGIEPSDARQRFRESDINYGWYGQYPIETSPIGTPPPRPKPGHNGKTLVHVRYQQWHQDWPIFGGQVVVHLATADRRTSVTSSYFPLDDTTDFSQKINRETAVALAQQALAGYPDDLEAIGLYWSLLRSLLEAQEAWQPVHFRVAEKMVPALATFSETHDHIFPDLEELAAGDLPQTLDQWIPLLQSIEERLDRAGLAEWQADVVPYAGSELFIFPFAGSYHLAYQVELLSPDYSQAWRVFVDAETGDILGRPENLILHVQYYATAGDVLKIPPVFKSKPLAGNPCQHFMEIVLYDSTPINWSHQDTSGKHFEATNVAIHAEKIYNHFVNVCGADPSKLQSYVHDGQEIKPGLRTRVAAPGTDFSPFKVFNHVVDPKLITFPTGILTTDGKQVHHLAYDPEVIYHEVTHGLMWLLRRYPFDHLIASVPFGRALVEGYANYFGRSLAAAPPDPDPDLSLWARAAYRKMDSGVTMWGDRWALSRTKLEPGADLLPAPNLYPHQQTTGLPVYDVAMIWARALWDLRSILDPDQVDRLALAAYYFVNGWVANFELAAEGVLDAAAKSGITDPNLKKLRQRFAERGILADQSIQALIRTSNVPLGDGQQGTVLLAGADAGLMRSINDGQNWEDWDDLQGGQKLTGVVVLAFENNTFYAAVEAKTSEDAPEPGIYQRASNGAEWSPAGEWPADQTPYSLTADDRKLYVGTGHGVWRCDLNDASKIWAVFECTDSLNGVACTDCQKSSEGCRFKWLGLDLTLASTSSNVNDLCVASFNTIRLREVNPGAPWRPKHIGKPSDRAAVVAVAAQGDSAYLGTLAHGIWRRGIASSKWTRIDVQGELSNVAVLTLAPHDNTLVAGTTGGVYVGTPGANDTWSWKPCPGLPDKAKVTIVLPIGNNILASTATHGLRRWDGNQWHKVPGVEKLTGES